MSFDKKLLLLQEDASEKQELLKKMATKLYDAHYVTESYMEGILEREEEYPTGLEINGIGIAIPHTDTNKVLKSQICLASLKKPIDFKDMVDKTKKIEVNIIFMLAMKESNQQIELLQNIMKLFQNEKTVQKILNSTNEEEVLELLHSNGIN